MGVTSGIGVSGAHVVNRVATSHSGNFGGNVGSAHHHHHHHGYGGNSFFFGTGSPFGGYSYNRSGFYNSGFYSGFGLGFGGYGYGGLGYGYGWPSYGLRYRYYGSPNFLYSPICSCSDGGYYPGSYYGSSYALPLYGASSIYGVSPAAAVVAAMPVVPAVPAAEDEKPATSPMFGGDEFAAQGEADFRDGKYAEAIHAWKHALVDDPTNGAYVLLLAQALFQTGKFEEAAGATQQAAQMLPDDKWGVVSGNYRQLYANIQDYTNQLRALEKARDAKPSEPAFHFLLGWHYGYLGYPKQALPELDKALELAPKDEVARKVRDAMAAKLEKPATILPAPATP